MKRRLSRLFTGLDDPRYDAPMRKRGMYRPTLSSVGVTRRQAANKMIDLMPGVRRSRHARLAKRYELQASGMNKTWDRIADRAARRAWGRPFQFGDYRVSGIASEAFTPRYKNLLRKLAHGGSRARGIATLHRAASTSRRINPWQYKRVSTHTLQGLREAEALQKRGWKMGAAGLFNIDFSRYVEPKKKRFRSGPALERRKNPSTSTEENPMRFRFPRRRRHHSIRRNSWFNHSGLHRRAAKLGWRRRRRSRSRRNPGPIILGGNPFRLGRRVRGRRSSFRRNPAAVSVATLKGAFSQANLMNVGGIAGGFILGVKATQFIVKPEFMKNMRKFAGAVHVLAGFILGAVGKKPIMRSLGMGVAAAGVYDLITQNVPQLKLSPISGVDLDSNEDSDMSGADVVDFEGADAGMIEVVGADLERDDEDAYAL